MRTTRLLLLVVAASTALAAPRGKKPPPPKDPPPVPVTAPAAPTPPPRPAQPRIALTSPTGGPGVPAELTTTLEQGLERELRRLQGPTVVTPGEVLSLLGAERLKQLLGGAPGALASLGDVTDLLTVTVTARESDVELVARRTPADGSVAKTSTRVSSAKTGDLLAVARPLVADLFPEFPVMPEVAPAAVAPSQRRVLRVAVLDPRVTGEVPRRARAALEQALTPELRKVEGLAAINSQEIVDLLGAERQKQLLGCSEDATSCMEELAGAVGADELVTIDLTLVGRTYALTARRLDTSKAKVLQTHLSQFEQRDGEELLAIVGPTVAALYPERALRAGAVRGVEAEVIRRLNPPPLPRWVFFTTLGLALGAGAASGGFYALAQDGYGKHQALAQQSVMAPVSARELTLLAAELHARDGVLRGGGRPRAHRARRGVLHRLAR